MPAYSSCMNKLSTVRTFKSILAIPCMPPDFSLGASFGVYIECSCMI